MSSAGDKCTIHSDRNLGNRRNVKGDVTAAANACRRFFVLEVEARIIAATLQIIGMQLEFFNKLVKEAIKKIGPGASKKSLDRVCHSLGITSSLIKNYDNNMSVFNRAGRHVKKSTVGDLEKIVNELVINKAFTCTPGRRYSCFSHVKPSLLTGFDMQKMFLWINAHKKYMILNRKAR